MPVIARFYGIVIKMYFNQGEHGIPHFHAIYDEYNAVFDIRTLEMLEGDLPMRAQKLIRELHSINKNYYRCGIRTSLSDYPDWSRTMNAPKIKSVTPLKEKRLLVTFVNGVQKIYDCQWLLNLERFQLLKNEAFFKAVTVDPGGYGISWNEEMDLSEYELWNRGVEVEPSTDESKEESVVERMERG